MKTTARNQLKGTISDIITGRVASEIVIDIGGRTALKAVITNDGKEEMELKVGDSVYALIKASFVMLSRERPAHISIRNVLETRIEDIIEGLVNCELKLTMGDQIVTAMVTEDAVKELEFKKGETVYALINANTIIIGVDE